MPVIYTDLGAVDLKRDSTVQYTRTREETAVPLPGACPAVLVPVGDLYSDDFHRANADHIGAAYTEYIGSLPHTGPGPYQQTDWAGISGNQLSTFAGLITPPAVDTQLFSRTGQFVAFPPLGKDQYSQLTFVSSTVAPLVGGNPIGGFSGRTEVMARMQPSGNPLGNSWFESGAGVAGSKSGVVAYFCRYRENYNSNGTFGNAFIEVGRHEISGDAGLSPPGPLGAFIPRLVARDVLTVTCANFMFFSTEVVCVKGFVNGVLKCQGVDFQNPVLPGQFGRILTGGAGFSCGEILPDPATMGFVCTMQWSLWEAQLCNPNPF